MTPSPAKPKLHYFSFDSLGNPWVSGGGAVRDLEILSRWTDKADITLFTAGYPGFRERVERGVRIRGLGYGGSNAAARVAYALCANIYALLSGADILGFSPSIFAPVWAGCFLNRRSYAVIHHAVGREARNKYGLAGHLFETVEASLFRFQKRWAVSNTVVLERIRALQPGADLYLTRNGIDPELLTLESVTPDRPYILYLGRFDIPMKGLDVLIRAYATATLDETERCGDKEATDDRFPDLVLAGRATEEQQKALEQLIPASLKARVRLETHVDESRKRDLLRNCFFFCSPSRYEGFGIAALEANAAGKAVLATRVDGFSASLRDGVTAELVEPGSADALAAALMRWFRGPDGVKTMGKAGRDWAAEFSWDAIAEREWEWISAIRMKSHPKP